jgi:cytochrome P450
LAFSNYVIDTLAARRAQDPTDDITSAIAHGEIDGRPLTELEQQMTMMLVIFGGLHTTTNALGGMFYWLADHPEDRRALRERPELIPSVLEEFLRFTSPVTYIGRTLSRDIELHGCSMAAGSKVLLAFGPANRDPAKFERSEDIVLDRQPNHHLAFGMGPHRCAGSHLAKLEMRIALEEFMKRVTDYHIEDHANITWVGGEARGPRSLPMVIDD